MPDLHSAMVVEDKKQILKNFPEHDKEAEGHRRSTAFAEYAAENVPVAGNMRGSTGIQNSSCAGSDKKSLGSSRRDEE